MKEVFASYYIKTSPTRRIIIKTIFSMWLWPPHASSTTVFTDMMGENEVIKYLISENWENWNNKKKEWGKKSIELDLVNVMKGRMKGKNAILCSRKERNLINILKCYWLRVFLQHFLWLFLKVRICSHSNQENSSLNYRVL